MTAVIEVVAEAAERWSEVEKKGSWGSIGCSGSELGVRRGGANEVWSSGWSFYRASTETREEDDGDALKMADGEVRVGSLFE